MSTGGHRNFLEKLTLGALGLRILRSRAVRWPLAALFAGLAVHAATGAPAQEGADRGFAVPAVLFLLGLFLVLMPLLPLADKWDEQR